MHTIHLTRSSYGSDEGKLSGNVSFTAATGEIKFNLTEEHCQKIVDIMADALIEYTQVAADKMHQAVIDSTSLLLEQKDNDQ